MSEAFRFPSLPPAACTAFFFAAALAWACLEASVDKDDPCELALEELSDEDDEDEPEDGMGGDACADSVLRIFYG